MAPERSKCEVCQDLSYKYKCPNCCLKYCSVACYKKHKGSESCEARATEQASAGNEIKGKDKNSFGDNQVETEDQVALEKLKMLGQSEEVLNLLQNPHVRTLMESLDKARHPAESVQKAMHEPIFLEFADACLNVVEPVDGSSDTNK